MKKCSKCNKLINDADLFCHNCGNPVTENDKTPTPPIFDKYEKKQKINKKMMIFLVFIILCLSGFMIYSFVSFNKVETIDLMSACDVSFEGVSGYGYVDINCSPDLQGEKQKDFYNEVTYIAEPQENLSNGDKVTVTAVYDEDVAKKNKIEAINTSKEFTVEGLTVKEFTKSEKEETSGKKFSTITSATEIVDILKDSGLPISNQIVFDDSLLRDEEITGVVSKLYFEDSDYAGKTLKDTAYLTGGTIEICENEAEAKNRLDIVNNIENHKYMYNYVFGKIYIRLDNVMSLERIQEYEKVFDELNDITGFKASNMRESGL